MTRAMSTLTPALSRTQERGRAVHRQRPVWMRGAVNAVCAPSSAMRERVGVRAFGGLSC